MVHQYKQTYFKPYIDYFSEFSSVHCVGWKEVISIKLVLVQNAISVRIVSKLVFIPYLNFNFHMLYLWIEL